MIAQNHTKKVNQLVLYASQMLKMIEQNYSTSKCEVVAIAYAMKKYKHYFFKKKF